MNKAVNLIKIQANIILDGVLDKSTTVGDLNQNLTDYFRRNRPFQEGLNRDVFALIEQVVYQSVDEYVSKLKLEP